MAVARWGSVVLGVVAVFTLAYAALDGLFVVSAFDCPLGMEFERTGSEVVESRLVPPMVSCHYEYFSGDGGSELYPPETVTYDATASWVVAIGFTALALAIGIPSWGRPTPSRTSVTPGSPRS